MLWVSKKTVSSPTVMVPLPAACSADGLEVTRFWSGMRQPETTAWLRDILGAGSLPNGAQRLPSGRYKRARPVLDVAGLTLLDKHTMSSTASYCCSQTHTPPVALLVLLSSPFSTCVKLSMIGNKNTIALAALIAMLSTKE